jgi:GEVED domain/CARDB/Domain of unknown function DUF11/Secretion system C-terminal sorting domain
MNLKPYLLAFILILGGINNLSSQNYAALVAGVTTLQTDGLPGEMAGATTPNSAAIAGKPSAAISVASITATNGKMLTVAHESFFTDNNINKGNNLIFATNVVNWLAPVGKKSILISSGHREWANPTNLTIFTSRAISNGYTVANSNGAITATNLAGIGVVVIGNAWGAISQAELDALAVHLQNGGGIVVLGLGWSWSGNPNDYPMNKVAALAGQRFLTGTNPSPITAFYPNVFSYNLTQAQAVIDSITTAHPTDLAAALQPSGALQDKWIGANNMLRNIVETTPVGSAERTTVYNFYKTQFNKRPNYFKKTVSFNRFTESFLGWSRENMFKVFRDALDLTPTTKADIATTLGLTGRYLDIWNAASVLLGDNNALDATQKEYLYQLFSLVPTNIHKLGIMTFKDLIDSGVGSLAYAYISATTNSYAVNSFSNTIGTFFENQFPSDISAGTVDIFCAAAPHELTHIIDAYNSKISITFKNRISQLIAQAGSNDLQYLRSMVTGAFFQGSPQEFLASIANQYQVDSKKVFQLARQRFDGNFKEPMNQALFFAEIYAQTSNITYFYNTTQSGVLTRTSVPFTKDAAGYINKLTYDGVDYNFVRDPSNGNVLSHSVGTPPPNTDYCVSKGNAPWTEWIAGVQFSNINNASQKEGYGNFTSLTANVTQGQSYPLSITRGFSWAADPANLPQTGNVWIDYNQNKTFETSELVASFPRATNSVNIVIPATATLGATRMRVSFKTIGSSTACEVFEKGEVEDYTVNITGGTGGGNLPDLTLSNLSTPTRVGNLLTYNVDVKNIGTGDATGNFSIKSYFSRDNVLSADDIQDGTIQTGNYQAGATTLQVAAASTIAANLSGTYYLLVKVDADNQISESNETNNVVASAPFELFVSPFSQNLQITNVTEQNAPEANGNFRVSITIKNNGTTASATDTIRMIKWRSSSFQPSFYDYENYTPSIALVPPIAAGQQTTITANFTLPAVLKTFIEQNSIYLEPYFGIVSKLKTAGIGTSPTASTVANFSYPFPLSFSRNADVSLSQATVLDDTYNQADPSVSYRFTVSNAGANTAKNIFVKLDEYGYRVSPQTIPAHLFDIQVAGAGRLYAENNTSNDFSTFKSYYQLDSLRAGESVQVTITAKVFADPRITPDPYLFVPTFNSVLQIAYGEYNDPNTTNNQSGTLAFTRSTGTPNNNCLNRFELSGFGSTGTDCFSGSVLPFPNFGNLQMYGNRIADGFMLNMIFNSNFSREVHFFAKAAPSNTPPANARFRNCTTAANWLYFTVNGVGRDERNDYIDENFNLRVRYWGAENNPDSIFIELDNDRPFSNSNGALTFKSVRKTANCNACFRNDVTPPAIACPTTTVIYNDPNFRNGDRLRTSQILTTTGITIAESSCATPAYLLTALNTNQAFTRGNTYPLTIVAYDSAGNKATCAINLLIPLDVPSDNYCASKAVAPWEYAISNVQFGTINNTSDKFKDFSTLGYSDYTNLTTTLAKGQSYPLSITPLLSWIGNVPNTFARVWIDYNQNKTFESSELVLEKNNANPLTQNVLIPFTALSGNTRMRVSLKFGNYPSACESFEKGEVEDYTVQITEGGVTIGQDVLKITSASSLPSVVPGNNLAVTFTVTNLGTAPNLPTKKLKLYNGYRLSSRPISYYSFDSISDETPIGVAISPNSTRTLTLNFRIDTSYTHLNTFQTPNSPVAIGAHIGLSDIPSYNSIIVLPDTFPSPFPLSAQLPLADLELITPATVTYAGNEVRYTVRIKNNSAITTPKVEVKAFDMPNFSPYQTAELTPNKGTVRTYNITGFETYVTGYWYVGSLAPNEEASCEVRIVSNQFATENFTANISAFAQSLTTLDPNISNNTKSIAIRRVQSNLPDLTISNLVVPSTTVQVGAGRVLGFRFDVGNNSTVAVPNSFRIKSYFSTDQVLSADDLVRGDFSTGNYVAGFSVNVGNSIDATIPEGQYYLIVKIDADNEILESNENNNIVVSPLLTMTNSTGGGGGSDIALSITSTPSVYRQYTTQNFRITANNSGTTAFSNVKIKFTRPALTVAGGTKVASIGTYSDYCPGGIECSEWTIPTLAGGTTATLDVPLFVLNPTSALTASANLVSSTPVDNSTANNTATVTINSANAPIISPLSSANQLLIQSKPTQLIPVMIQTISPTITENFIVVELESIVEKTIDFNIINSFGSIVFTEKLTIEKGNNKRHFDVSQLPQGLYFIQTNVGKGRNVPTKFIKL